MSLFAVQKVTPGFMDIRTALRFFLHFGFFLVSVIIVSFFFSFSVSGVLSLS